MHLNAKLPIFVPVEHMREIEALSKAALMDLVWDYAVRCAGSEEGAIEEFRQSWATIKGHRDRHPSRHVLARTTKKTCDCGMKFCEICGWG